MRIAVAFALVVLFFGAGVLAQEKQPAPKELKPAKRVVFYSETVISGIEIITEKSDPPGFSLKFTFTAAQTGYEVSADAEVDDDEVTVTVDEIVEKDRGYADALEEHALEIDLEGLKAKKEYGVRFEIKEDKRLVGVCMLVTRGEKGKAAEGARLGIFYPVTKDIQFVASEDDPPKFTLKFPAGVGSIDNVLKLEKTKVDEDERLIKIYIRDKTPADQVMRAQPDVKKLETEVGSLTEGTWHLDVYCATRDGEFVHAYRWQLLADSWDGR